MWKVFLLGRRERREKEQSSERKGERLFSSPHIEEVFGKKRAFLVGSFAEGRGKKRLLHDFLSFLAYLWWRLDELRTTWNRLCLTAE
jgi:hypothetical protein